MNIGDPFVKFLYIFETTNDANDGTNLRCAAVYIFYGFSERESIQNWAINNDKRNIKTSYK